MHNRFKDTELGSLPEEWEVVRLGEFLQQVKEKNKSNKKYSVFTISNIYGFISSDDFFDKKVYSKNISTYKIVRINCFAYNPYRINVGSLGLFNEDIGLVSPAYVVFKISKPEHLYSKFLYNILKSQFYLSEIKRAAMSRGSVRRSLSFKDLSDFKIPLPPLSEQKKIAVVLSTVQEAKEKTEEVIKVAKELKKSLMKHLFTYGPVPVEEAEKVPLKETEIGPVPKEWEVVRLGDCLKLIRNGTTKKQNKDGRGYPVTRIETISEERIDFKKAAYINGLRTNDLAKYKMRTGDILFSHINSEPHLGKSAIYEGFPPILIHGMNLLLIRSKRNMIYPYFLYYIFNLYRIKGIFISIASRAVNQSSINQGKLKMLQIPLPPVPIQQKIAETLSSVDRKIEAEENRKKTLEELFKTLLSNLMTARIRVNQLGIEI